MYWKSQSKWAPHHGKKFFVKTPGRNLGINWQHYIGFADHNAKTCLPELGGVVCDVDFFYVHKVFCTTQISSLTIARVLTQRLVAHIAQAHALRAGHAFALVPGLLTVSWLGKNATPEMHIPLLGEWLICKSGPGPGNIYTRWLALLTMHWMWRIYQLS